MISLDFITAHLPEILKVGIEVVTIVYGVVRFLEKRFLIMLGEHFYAKADGERLAKRVTRISTELGIESESINAN